MKKKEQRLKNIVIVYDCANINGGAAKVAIQSAIGLSELGYNVYYFAAVGPIDEGLQQSNVKVKCLGLNDINHGSRIQAIINGIWNRAVRKEYVRFLDDFSPKDTIIHIHGWAKALSSVVVKESTDRRFKTFITLHDYFTLCPNGGFYDYQKQKICKRKPMSLACVFCNCDKRNYAQKIWRVARQVIQDKYIRKNKRVRFISISQLNEEVVKPYVESKRFYRVDNPIQLAKEQIEDCSRSNVFLYIGRVSEEKGIELFCKAITKLKNNYDIQGVVVGDGPIYEDMKQHYPNINFEGWKSPEEVQEYIKNARSLILPSKWYEGSPLSIIEALSAGLPCIVSSCTSATEVIQDNTNGLVFKDGNVQDLIVKIEKMLNNDYVKKLSSYAKLQSIDLYTNCAHCKRIIEVYKQY